jgi:hypothetical protein
VRKIIILVALFIGFFLLPRFKTAFAASYYVSPNGGGSTCSQASPCSLSGGIDKAGNGDELILKDGKYKSLLYTKRPGVTIRSENTHKAIVTPPDGFSGSPGSEPYVRINHSDTTIRGIIMDGERRARGILWILRIDTLFP